MLYSPTCITWQFYCASCTHTCTNNPIKVFASVKFRLMTHFVCTTYTFVYNIVLNSEDIAFITIAIIIINIISFYSFKTTWNLSINVFVKKKKKYIY